MRPHRRRLDDSELLKRTPWSSASRRPISSRCARTLSAGRHPTAEKRQQFYDALLARLGTVPGVSAVATATRLPARRWGRATDRIRRTAGAGSKDHPAWRIRFRQPGVFRRAVHSASTRAALARSGRRCPDRKRSSSANSSWRAFSRRGGARQSGSAIAPIRERKRRQSVADDRGCRAQRPTGESSERRSRSGGVSAVPAAIAREHRHPRAGGRNADVDRVDACVRRSRKSTGISRCSDLKALDEELCDAAKVAVSVVFGSMFSIFAPTALVLSAVGILRRHVARRDAAHIGDWRPHGAGAQPKQVSWLILKSGCWQLAIGLTRSGCLEGGASRS